MLPSTKQPDPVVCTAVGFAVGLVVGVGIMGAFPTAEVKDWKARYVAAERRIDSLEKNVKFTGELAESFRRALDANARDKR